jgi:RNA polymerase sigma factor (TIGR02999 family)
LLLAWRQGDQAALAELITLVYDELHRLAERQLQGQRRETSLRTTELVHEAFLRLVDQQRVEWRSRSHFYAVAALVMRRVLVDYARARRTDKRGGAVIKLPLDVLDETLEISHERATELIALDDALTGLEKLDAQQAQVVELRFFGGLTGEEIAELLHISPRTVARQWEAARLWLYREISQDKPSNEGGPA